MERRSRRHVTTIVIAILGLFCVVCLLHNYAPVSHYFYAQQTPIFAPNFAVDQLQTMLSSRDAGSQCGSDAAAEAGGGMLCAFEYTDTERAIIDSLDIDVVRQQFYRIMTTINDSLCGANFTRFGRAGDGGYDVCMTSHFAPRRGDCLVYSFGISTDWSFDEDMAKYGCEVHSFDPSLGLVDHLHSDNVHFHNLGLWGSDMVTDQQWTLRRLSTIRDQLGHSQRVIDVLKVDVEAAEWPFLRDFVDVDPTQSNSIRQLLLETHTPRRQPQPVSKSDLIEMIYYVSRLSRRLGLRAVRNRQANWCCGAFSPLMPSNVPEKCCHETFYVNTRFLSNDR